MERLSRDPNAFIRPSPSQSQLGGVARRTREAIELCEAAGFDVILIETVGGVGGNPKPWWPRCLTSSCCCWPPAGGDELQGVKRGIMEMADLILVNKADGDLKPAATRTCADYSGALRLLRKRPQDPTGFPKAMMVSAVEEMGGLEQAWSEMTALIDWRRENGHFDATRARQAEFWFAEEVRRRILRRLESGAAKDVMETLAAQVAAGKITATRAAEEALSRISG